MKGSIIKIILTIFISHSSLHAQGITLGECIRIALENNYSLQIVKNENEIAQNNYTKGNAGFLPSVDATTRYSGSLKDNGSKDFSDVKSSTNGQLTNAGGASVNATWDIFSGMKAHARYNQLGELKDVSDLNTIFAIENLIANVASEYYYIIQQEKHRNNLEFLLSISKERLRIAEIGRQLQSQSRLDILQAQVDFNADSSRLVRKSQEILSSKIRLKILMGELERGDIIVDSTITLLSQLDYDAFLEQTLNENTQLQIAAKQINISEQELRIIRSASFPYLRLTTGYGYNYNRYNKGANKSAYNNELDYGLTLGINIFDGNNRKRQIKNARLTVENRQLAKDETVLDVKGKFLALYTSYTNNISLIKMEQQNHKTALENFKVAAERYRLGELAGVDLRDAQNSLQDAEERLLGVEFNAKIDEISLMMLSGNITEYL